jgi:hypothetical protein
MGRLMVWHLAASMALMVWHLAACGTSTGCMWDGGTEAPATSSIGGLEATDVAASSALSCCIIQLQSSRIWQSNSATFGGSSMLQSSSVFLGPVHQHVSKQQDAAAVLTGHWRHQLLRVLQPSLSLRIHFRLTIGLPPATTSNYQEAGPASSYCACRSNTCGCQQCVAWLHHLVS